MGHLRFKIKGLNHEAVMRMKINIMIPEIRTLISFQCSENVIFFTSVHNGFQGIFWKGSVIDKLIVNHNVLAVGAKISIKTKIQNLFLKICHRTSGVDQNFMTILLSFFQSSTGRVGNFSCTFAVKSIVHVDKN